MKKRRILIHSIFLTLIVLSLVVFCLETERQYRIDVEKDDIFGGSFTIFVCFLVFFPAFCFEIELYRVVRYFVLCRQKTKKKTVINLVSLFFLPVLFLGVFIVHCLSYDASAVILSNILLVTPLHFLVMRMVAFHWWSSEVDAENAGGKP